MGCGYNQYGGLGLGHYTNRHTPEKINNLPPIISISAGNQFSLFFDANGSVWSCGYNPYGQFGLGDVKHRRIPEQIKNLPKITSALALGGSLFLDFETSFWSCGYNWDWETQSSETKQKRFKDFLQSNQLEDRHVIIAKIPESRKIDQVRGIVDSSEH